jgi:hypothetical protein
MKQLARDAGSVAGRGRCQHMRCKREPAFPVGNRAAATLYHDRPLGLLVSETLRATE